MLQMTTKTVEEFSFDQRWPRTDGLLALHGNDDTAKITVLHEEDCSEILSVNMV